MYLQDLTGQNVLFVLGFELINQGIAHFKNLIFDFKNASSGIRLAAGGFLQFLLNVQSFGGDGRFLIFFYGFIFLWFNIIIIILVEILRSMSKKYKA